MLRNFASVIGFALILVLSTTESVWAADFGTAEEAKAMLAMPPNGHKVMSRVVRAAKTWPSSRHASLGLGL